MSRYLHISPDEAFEGRIRDAFGGALGGDLRRFDSPVQLSEQLTDAHGAHPEVIVLGPGLPTALALDLAARLDADCPDVGIMAVTDPAPDVLADLLRVGVRDVVAPDAGPTEIRRSVEWAGQVAAARRTRAGSATPGEGEADGRIVAVASPKGGAGKTTVATNLAVTLAQQAPGSVVLVDFDLQFGDVASALQLDPEHTIADAVGSLATRDTVALKVYLAGHPSGLFVLAAPDTPADGERVSAEQAGELIGMLAQEFRYVVVDTAAGVSEHALATFEVATDVVFVCTSDVPSVRNLRKELAVLDQLDLGVARRHVVLNHADARAGVPPADVEEALGLPLDVRLPSSPAVLAAVNEGVPLAQSKPRCAYARQIADLSGRFLPRPVARPGLLALGRNRR